MFIENISTYGGEIDLMFLVVLIVTGIAFFLVEGILIYFLIQYRHREGRRAVYTHGNRRVEIMWTGRADTAPQRRCGVPLPAGQ